MPENEPLLSVEDLRVAFPARNQAGGMVDAVNGMRLRVDRGEVVGVVGESGCGKTMMALSILGLVPRPGRIVAGKLTFEGRDLLAMDEEQLRRVRGAGVAMTFQDPMSALNPLVSVGDQIREAMAVHDRFPGHAAAERVVPLMQRVHIKDAVRRRRDYPHQFSGGMKQRVMVAMGVANDPSLLIADEPTTALDATTQAQVIRVLRELNERQRTAVLLITHNMGLVAAVCERLVVMYAGRVVEEGPVGRVFRRPQHPYTWALLRSVPSVGRPAGARMLSIAGQPPDRGRLPAGCTFHPRCPFSEARCSNAEPPLGPVAGGGGARCWVLMDNVAEVGEPIEGYRSRPLPASGGSGAGRSEPVLVLDQIVRHFARSGGRPGVVRAVDGVSFEVHKGETLGLIGESGCGKTTLARIIAQLLPPTSGHIRFEGRDLASLRRRELREVRRRLQIVFQDPFSSLDPRMTVDRIVGEPLANFDVGTRRDRRRRVGELLDRVGLEPGARYRYPHEFSGGQRQRIGIARALALHPSVVICDEPVSALDVSIQAQIVNLLLDLQAELGLTYVFIAHDLGIVRSVADRVAVMYLGKIVEVAANDSIFQGPQHPYTRLLLDSVLPADPSAEQRWARVPTDVDIPASAEPPSGCRFRDRCVLARPDGICSTEEPALVERGRRHHRAACHFAEDAGRTAAGGEP